MSVQGTVYVLHIEPPFKHAGHYVGWTERSPVSRLAEHLDGRGSPLVRAAHLAGHRVSIVALFSGDRHLERKLKRQGGHGNRLCPHCREAYLERRRERRRAKAVAA